MRITQHDIAREAGVSRSLVSMALNGTGRVDPNTSRRIARAAKKLGYRPDMIGKTMRTGQSMTVGVLIRACDSYFGQMLLGIQETLQKHSYVPVVLAVNKQEFEPLEQVKRLLAQRVDGIILKPEYQLFKQHVQEVVDCRIPLVTVDNYVPDAGNIDFSGVNDEQLGYDAAGYFLKMGHRHLAVATITGDMHLLKRVNGFKRHIEAAGGFVTSLDADDYDDFSWREKFTCSGATGIFFMSDIMAAEFIELATIGGAVIPRDFSVLGTGNYELGKYCTPKLTTFEQHSKNIGINAARMLIERMSGDTPYDANQRSMLETPQLIERDSVIKI